MSKIEGNPATLGGKGESLLRLSQMGFPVPPFAVLTDADLKGISLSGLEAKLPGFLETHGLEFPLAVRSSAQGEDGHEHSFAGMFESILNVQDFPSLNQAIQKVRDSQNSVRVQTYRLQLAENAFGMAVILQKMVPATEAGVLFTANPVNGRRSQMMISSVQGLGEKLVSGETDGETLILESQGQVFGGKASEILTGKKIQQLHQLGKRAVQIFGEPLDIEWAFHQEQLFILQARPITTPLIGNSVKKLVFDNSNIQESYCGVTTPLTFSYASEAYCQVYNQLMKLMGFSAKEIEQAQGRHRHLLGFINGRIYYNINSWYEGLLYLPHFGRRKEDMEKMMGLEKPVSFVQDYSLSRREKLSRLLPMAALILKMIYRFSRIDSSVAKFDRWFWNLSAKYDRAELPFLENEKLAESLRQLQEESLKEWGIPVLNDFLVMISYGSIKRDMDRHGLGEKFQDMMKGSDLASLEPTLELQKMAADLFNLTETEISKYVERYGDRCIGELKLETKTHRQSSENLKKMIAQMAQSPMKKSMIESLTAREGEFFKSYREQAGWLKSLNIKKRLKKLKKAVADRELMRFHRTRLFGLMRSYYLEIGLRFSELKVIDQKEDIFYLTRDEIFDYFNGKAITSSLNKLVALRKSETELFEKMEMPQQVAIHHPVGHWMGLEKAPVVEREDSPFLQGLGCSSGIVRGCIRYVSGPDDIENLEGCILLAERTDPGWTPLFTFVKGVIIERGSALSHSAVIARELGIPAIVSVSNVTRILKDGDEVEIDGSCGRIEILQRQAPGTQPFSDSGTFAE